MGVSAAESEKCPRCEVLRAPLPDGGWCPTCGYNPKHEAELQHLREFLADTSLCPDCHRQREEFLRGLPEGRSCACIIAALQRKLDALDVVLKATQEAYDEVFDRNERLTLDREAMQAQRNMACREVERLREVLGCVIPNCEWLHHSKADQHHDIGKCPVEDRLRAALNQGEK